MRNLEPRRRTDKNGVTSTRWVKPDQTMANNTKAFPPPGPKARSLQFRKDTLRKAIDLGPMKGNKNAEKMLAKHVNKLSEVNVDHALQILNDHPGQHVNKAVRHSIESFSKDTANNEEWLQLSLQFAAIESVYDEYLKTSLFGSPYRAEAIMAGVSAALGDRGDRHLSKDLHQLDEGEIKEALLAGYVAAIVETHQSDFNKDRSLVGDYKYVFQDHAELVGVFVEFSDKLPEMLSYVYENGESASALRQHMRGDHSALSGGAL